MSARIAAMNRALEEMVKRIGDPDVRLVPVPALAEKLDEGEDPAPDGMHYSPRMRRLVADWIADEIDESWARRNP
jgi:lysophospholipase L1-like esterase